MLTDEKLGEDYNFVTPQLFRFFIDEEHMLEWGQFKEHFYGSLKERYAQGQREIREGDAESVCERG